MLYKTYNPSTDSDAAQRLAQASLEQKAQHAQEVDPVEVPLAGENAANNGWELQALLQWGLDYFYHA